MIKHFRQFSLNAVSSSVCWFFFNLHPFISKYKLKSVEMTFKTRDFIPTNHKEPNISTKIMLEWERADNFSLQRHWRKLKLKRTKPRDTIVPKTILEMLILHFFSNQSCRSQLSSSKFN